MNQILLSFLCGAAFIGGAVAMTILVIMAKSFSLKQDREELYGYWKESLVKQERQLALMVRICMALENKKDKKE